MKMVPTTKMDPAIKKTWIAALRSGDYQQGTGQLRTAENEFCCLGVLCNLHAIAHPEIAAKQQDQTRYMTHKTMPNREILDWAGLCWSAADKLAGKNDSGESFKDLAAYIRRYL